jgi:hypothetical protein
LPNDSRIVLPGKEAIQRSGGLEKLKEQWFKKAFWGKEIPRNVSSFRRCELDSHQFKMFRRR